MAPIVLSEAEWQKLLKAKKIEDISDKLEDSFLVVYQTMRALIRYEGKVYFATGWGPPSGDPYVELIETKDYA